VAASAKDAATMCLLYGFPRGATFASDDCVTDALDGTDALLRALRGTDYRILVLRSVAVLCVCEKARSHKDFYDAATRFGRFAVSFG